MESKSMGVINWSAYQLLCWCQHTSWGNNEQDLSVKTLNMEVNLLVFATIPAISFLHINLLAVVTMPFLSAAWTRRIMVIQPLFSSRSLVHGSFQTRCESRRSLSLAWMKMLFGRRRTWSLRSCFKWHLNYVAKDKYSASVGRQQCGKQ